MTVFIVETTNFKYKNIEKAEEKLEKLEKSTDEYKKRTFSDFVTIGGEKYPIPPINIGDKAIKPSQIMETATVIEFIASFGGNGKSRDGEIREDTPTIEWGRDPYFKFDFSKSLALVKEEVKIPFPNDFVCSQFFFYIRNLLLIEELKEGIEEGKKD